MTEPELVMFGSSALVDPCRIWPAKEILPEGLIREAKTYYFELRNDRKASDAELLIDDIALKGLKPRGPDTALWEWSPGFHAGAVEMCLQLRPFRQVRFELVTDPDLRKLTKSDFDTMVAEILEDSFALFSISSFRKGISRGIDRNPPPIARLEFLRSRIELIEKAVRAINRQPRRILRQFEEIQPYHKVKNITGIEINQSLRGGKILKATAGNSRLPAILDGHMPRLIRKKISHDDSNIREHQEIRAVLKYWTDWLYRAEGKIQKTQTAMLDVGEPKERSMIYEAWVSRIAVMRQKLNMLLALPIFAELPDKPARLTLSPIFKNVESYRSFYKLYREFNLGIANVLGDFLQVSLARTYELYELWCFLRLVRVALKNSTNRAAGSSLFTFDPRKESLAISANEVQIPVREGLRLAFQKRFREYWLSSSEDRVGSFSRVMVPDISVISEGDEGTDLIVLDSKYRIEEGLGDALTSIHTYRDAIVQGDDGDQTSRTVKGAYLLCPRIGNFGESDFRDVRMPGRLFHPEYRSTFKFGAILMRPGMTEGEISQILDLIVSDAAAHD